MHFNITFRQRKGRSMVTGLTVELSTDNNCKEQNTTDNHEESNWMNAAQARARRRLKLDLAPKKQRHNKERKPSQARVPGPPLPPPPLPPPPLPPPPLPPPPLRL